MLEQARALHRAGQLVGARRLYRAILATNPDDAEACRLLGMLEAQRGNVVDARALLARARGADVESAAAYAALGDVQQALRRYDAALASYDCALARDPRQGATHNDRGIVLAQLGRAAEALASFDRALEIEPARAPWHLNRARALHAAGGHADALASSELALTLEPDSPDAWNQRGLELAALDRIEDAVASFDRALVLRADFPEALANRAAAASQQGEGSSHGVGDEPARLAAALVVFDRVLERHPKLAEVRVNRGTLLRELGRSGEALAEYDAALAAKPGLVAAHVSRGLALAALGRNDEALASFDRGLALGPPSAELLAHRGSTLAAQKRHDEAARDFAGALVLDPAQPAVPGLLFHARANVCEWEGRDQAAQRLVADARDGRRSASPLVMLSISDSAEDQLACARAWSRAVAPAARRRLWNGERYGHSRIRVAYLSSDLDEHAVAYLLAGVFEAHDRGRFEVVALSSGPDPEGGMRARLKAAFERLVDVRGRSDREIAAVVREHEVDVVVDLNGHTLGSRLGVLALRPAPVAVSYLGFPGTLGADYVDYLIADRFVIPDERRSAYAEQVVHLPDTFQANDRKRPVAATAPARAELGLPEGVVVFCAFNNSYKITPRMFDTWMRLVDRCEGSVLWLLDGVPALRDNLKREARARNVDPARLVFAPRLPYADHLARLCRADLFLDTLPFNGGTTASDALWAGVPVVTCTGDAMAARMAGSLLTALEVPELVTASLPQYEALALALAQDRERLRGLGARIARGRATGPLFDSARFCRHLEAAYATMVERARRGELPAAFAVDE